ncbi:MAG TPA: tetratricopeptide repeat protein [Acidobacteriaceae bacterium]|nr:tetratricopeptide repeat protein [Acidobacteriaceae bacterium]
MKRHMPGLLASALGLLIFHVTCIAQVRTANDASRSTALALEQQGHISDAETAWQAIARSDPADAEAPAHLGLLEARQGHYDEAIPLYRKALALNPAMPGLRMNLGLAYYKSGDLRSAATIFETLLGANPKGSPEALRLVTLLGLARYGLGDYARAVPYLKEAAAADPQNLSLRMLLAHSCLWSKQYQCVLDTYHEILTINPESAEADMLAGEADDELKNDAGALEQFQAAIKANPALPNVHFGYGYLLWKDLKFEESKREFEAELTNAPDHPLALAYLGDTELRLDHADVAAPCLEHAIRILPSIAVAHLDLGIIYDQQGRKDDALRELKAAEKLNPSDPAVHWRLGRFYQSVGQKAEARSELEQTQKLQNATAQSLREQMHQVESQPQAGGHGSAPK